MFLSLGNWNKFAPEAFNLSYCYNAITLFLLNYLIQTDNNSLLDIVDIFMEMLF